MTDRLYKTSWMCFETSHTEDESQARMDVKGVAQEI
jgi:hypothetical protein